MLRTFLQAALLGFSVAAPVGPIGVLCIRRTLADGRAVGLACGLGAATADAIYGLVAGLGVTAAGAALSGPWAVAVRVVGCAYLAFLGVRTLAAAPARAEAAVAARSVGRAWGSTFFLTITNPMTIMSFAAMFSAIAPVHGARPLAEAPLLVGGVFLGSATWWLLLSTVVHRVRGRIGERHMRWINRAAGVLLIGFALVALAGVGAPAPRR